MCLTQLGKIISTEHFTVSRLQYLRCTDDVKMLACPVIKISFQEIALKFLRTTTGGGDIIDNLNYAEIKEEGEGWNFALAFPP